MSQLRPFTHRIYVDFSGDDGDPRTPGASASITAAWVICRHDAIRDNQGIVLAIKKLIGCKPRDNLRYRALRTHSKRRQALSLLSGLKGKVILIPVVKKHIKEEQYRNPKTKRLVSILHTLPLHRVFDDLRGEEDDPYIQLILDEVGWGQCKAEVSSQFHADEGLDWSRARPDWVLFAKSGSNLMLQLYVTP